MANYTENEQAVTRLAADGTNQYFAIDFEFSDDEDIKVFIDDELQLLDIDYNMDDNVVRFVTAPPGATRVIMVRQTVLNRLTDFETSGRFTANLVDSEYNQLLRQIADNRLTSNNISVPLSKTGDFDSEIKNFTSDQYLKLNADGKGIECGDVNQLIESAVSAAESRINTTVDSLISSVTIGTGTTVDVSDLGNASFIIVSSDGTVLQVGDIQMDNGDIAVLQPTDSGAWCPEHFNLTTDPAKAQAAIDRITDSGVIIFTPREWDVGNLSFTDKDITFYGNGSTLYSSSEGILLDIVMEDVYKGVQLIGMKFAANLDDQIAVRYTGTGQIFANEIPNKTLPRLTVDRCVFTSVKDTYGYFAKHLDLIDCTMPLISQTVFSGTIGSALSGNDTIGISWVGTAGAMDAGTGTVNPEDADISSCKFYDIDTCIYSSGCRELKTSDLTMKGFDYGIYISTDEPHTVDGQPGLSIKNSTLTPDGGTMSIYLNRCNDISISGNKLASGTDGCITVEGCYGASIVNNNIKGTAGVGTINVGENDYGIATYRAVIKENDFIDGSYSVMFKEVVNNSYAKCNTHDNISGDKYIIETTTTGNYMYDEDDIAIFRLEAGTKSSSSTLTAVPSGAVETNTLGITNTLGSGDFVVRGGINSLNVDAALQFPSISSGTIVMNLEVDGFTIRGRAVHKSTMVNEISYGRLQLHNIPVVDGSIVRVYISQTSGSDMILPSTYQNYISFKPA